MHPNELLEALRKLEPAMTTVETADLIKLDIIKEEEALRRRLDDSYAVEE